MSDHDLPAGAGRDDPTGRTPYSRHGTPAPLSVAAALTFVQGLLTLVFGLVEVLHLAGDRLVMGVTTGLFFLAYGAGLLLCAWGLHAVRAWARGPVLLAQLIWLGLAWNFRDGADPAAGSGAGRRGGAGAGRAAAPPLGRGARAGRRGLTRARPGPTAVSWPR